MNSKTSEATDEVISYFSSAEFLAKEVRRQEIMHGLMANGMPFLSATVIAGDLQSAEEATERVKQGVPPEEALHFVGSYARFDWAVANLPKEVLFKRLPELWVGADPDDTNPEYLRLWREAFAANQGVIIQDDLKASLPNRRRFKIYRGQVGDQVGTSWTLDYEIARKFAVTGGTRQPVAGGKILELMVTRADVLAYLTGRCESELIIDVERQNVKEQL